MGNKYYRLVQNRYHPQQEHSPMDPNSMSTPDLEKTVEELEDLYRTQTERDKDVIVH